jgi:hypothetical protein
MKREDLLKYLEMGAGSWNQAKSYLGEEVFDLREVDLRDRRLFGGDFSEVDLRGANLNGCDLRKADFTRARLSGASLRNCRLDGATIMNASLIGANLSGAVLSKACLRESALMKAVLADADLSYADLSWTNLGKANLARATLECADLTGANLVETNITSANFRGCYVFGASVWDVIGDPTDQRDLIITSERESPITVDDLRVAQFLYLMLSNDKLRATIDAISRKIVLILGRFLPARKIVLNAIREALRAKGYIPILFDFSKPVAKTFIETVSIFAHLSRFVIADFSDGRIVYHEVPHIAQTVAVPIKPILSADVVEPDPVTLLDLRVGSSKVLDILRYRSVEHLLEVFTDEVLQPAEERAAQLEKEKSF